MATAVAGQVSEPILSEKLVMYNMLYNRPRAEPSRIFDAIRREFPSTSWTEETVRLSIRNIELVSRIPGWLHRVLWEFDEEASGMLSVENPVLVTRIMDAAAVNPPHISSQDFLMNAAQMWITNCIRSLRMHPHWQPAVCGPVDGDMWSLSKEAKQYFLMELSLSEHETLVRARQYSK
jgi:hypothetical protein